MICTGVITVFAAMIISADDIRTKYVDNLLGGLAMHLAGPELLRLVFHIFVVIVGILILSGAVNTSIIGANGVLNRVAEDGVLLDWFRKPHKRFGTTFRIINLIALLQIATIIASRGDVYLLGEAYAFGVVWSFFLKSLGVLALRYQRHDQEYKFPFNIRMGGVEIPIGLGVTTMILGFVADRQSVLQADRHHLRRRLSPLACSFSSRSPNTSTPRSGKLTAEHKTLEEFNLDHQPQVSAACLARAARLRSGGGARLPPHGALQEGLAEDQPAAARHRGDDRAHHLDRRRRIRSFRSSRFSATTSRSCSATWWRWPRRKASRWSCWWCRP